MMGMVALISNILKIGEQDALRHEREDIYEVHNVISGFTVVYKQQ